MPAIETRSGHDIQHEEVLTLTEAASFLRVSEGDLEELLAHGAIPAQKIGGEWRFLKRALGDWLCYGPLFYREFRGFPPPWLLEYPVLEELLLILEKRLLSRLATSTEPPVKRGSKQAVLKHFGVFKDDPGMEEMLSNIYARRKADE
jgi:excisionase family DNA binding protein